MRASIPQRTSMEKYETAAPKMFYGWTIVLVSFITLTLVMGTRFTFGVFYTSILTDTGWSRAATAGIFSVAMLVYAVVALGVGALFDWLGPRRMFPLAAVLLGGGFFLCSQITSLWQFYFYYGVIVGIGFTALGFIPHVSLIARWFQRRRGLATSLVLAGMGAGSLIFAPTSEYFITHYGWRQGFLFYAILVPVIIIPTTLLWCRDSPAELGLYPDGATSFSATPSLQASPTARQTHSCLTALQTQAFWALFFIIFTIAFCLMTLIVHQNQYLIDLGFSQEFAAWMLGLSGLLRSGGNIIWGYVSDRTTREMSFTLSALLGLLAMPCLLLLALMPTTALVLFAVALMGLGYGGTSVVYGASAADLFQGPHFGKILGIMEIGFGLGACLGSYLAGFLFDHFHTYHMAFYIVMGLIVLSIGAMWLAAPRSARIGPESLIGKL